MRLILLLLFISSAFAQPCGPHEIYVREQWINTYIKQGGIKVSAHTRKSHCRELKRLDYFQDSSKQTFKNIKTNIQKWSPEEKKILEKYLERLPAWLKKYKLTEVLRGDIGGNSINPAAAVPLTKTLLIFDNFFKSSNKQDIINHEISHIAFHNIDPKHSINFAFLSGWKLEKGKRPVPPVKVIMPDSAISVGEDFANQVEVFHSNPDKLLNFNSQTFRLIQELIKQEESLK